MRLVKFSLFKVRSFKLEEFLAAINFRQLLLIRLFEVLLIRHCDIQFVISEVGGGQKILI